MNTSFKINGIHHITAIASSAVDNLAFYEKVLGLRLVKKTVNFDDPYTYHLYYGDLKGSPGTLLTFFLWQNSPRGETGAGMVTSIAFAVPTDSIGYWQKRLNLYGIETKKSERFGDWVIQFENPHGLLLELITTAVAPPNFISKDGPIPADHSIIGLHSAAALLNSLESTQFLLMDLMAMRSHAKEGNRYRFAMTNDDAFGHFFDVVIDPRAENGRQSSGTVHHIAFRTPTNDEQKDWRKLLMENGFSVTPIIDRKYFKSIYFHEPGGVLFEIATDPPGFAVDEPYERLGHYLKLPAQYEPMRAAIKSRLPRLRPSGLAHESLRAQD